MDECQHAMAELRNIVEGISKLRDTAYAHYSLLVEQVLKDQITDEQQLEQIMDGLCDFCDEIRFIDLYRSLCRHIYYQYPQLVGEHVALFRALFEGPDENDLREEIWRKPPAKEAQTSSPVTAIRTRLSSA